MQHCAPRTKLASLRRLRPLSRTLTPRIVRLRLPPDLVLALAGADQVHLPPTRRQRLRVLAAMHARHRCFPLSATFPISTA